MAHGGKRLGAGRPKGKPNAVTADVREAAQQYGTDALRTLAEIMASQDQPAAARVAASKEILDRAYGKSQQAIELSGKDGSPIQTVTQTMTPQEAAAAYANTIANG